MSNYEIFEIAPEVPVGAVFLAESHVYNAREAKFLSSTLRAILLWTCAISLCACSTITGFRSSDEPIPVMITGVHHLGPSFNIGELYINDKYASNVGRNGGGAGDFCCSSLPRRWRPGLIAKVQWSVNDWSKALRSELDAGNYKSVSFQNYVAIAPIEKYEEVGDLYPHFFAGGKVRLISSNYPINNPRHPVQESDPTAIELGIQGEKIGEK